MLGRQPALSPVGGADLGGEVAAPGLPVEPGQAAGTTFPDHGSPYPAAQTRSRALQVRPVAPGGPRLSISGTVSLKVTQVDTPSIRIHQSGLGGQEWGVAGNELAFEIRDVTAVTSPVVIEASAPTHGLTVEAGGVVASGAGFRFPDGSLQTKATGGAPAPAPETGQTTCWDEMGTVIACAGTGRDGDLRRGVQWPVPRFMDNGDGTVTDNLTGLIWLKDASCGDLAGTDASGSGIWTTALSAAAALANGTCGQTDGSVAGNWRLPQVQELQSLIDYEFIIPALSNTAGTAEWTEGDAFSDVQFSIDETLHYWSSTTGVDTLTRAWRADLGKGFVLPSFKDTSFLFVWPVRGGK